MIGDDPLGQSARCLAVLSDEIDERLKQVRLEDVGLALQDVADPIQAHSGVDGGALQRHQDAISDPACDCFGGRWRAAQVATLVVLRQHEIPELCEAIAVVGVAVRLAASRIAAAVPPDLGVWTARPATQAPPVVSQASDVLGRDPGPGRPDLECLVVRRVDRDTQPINRHMEALDDQLPRQGDRSFLEVRPGGGEVPEHFKECGVPVGLAHLLDIAGAQALLRAREAGRGRLAKAQVVGLKRLHSGRDEERARVAVRHQRRAWQDQMLPTREML